MHTVMTADVAREVVADRLRAAEERRRTATFTRTDQVTSTPRVRRRNAWLRRVRIAVV